MKTLTFETLKKMTADPDCIKVVNALFEAVAYTETVSDIIEPKEQEVVSFYQFKVAQKNLERWPEDDKIIDSPSRMYLSDDEDFEIYLKEMNKFHNEMGFKNKSPDNCPLLEAESLVRTVRIQVCNFLEPYIQIKYSDISGTLKGYKAYYDLIMKIFAQAVSEYQKVNPCTPKQITDF
ncbi:MAG: hypothetical protein HQ522_06440 [Bacteroidetes bacterium]|nr:hypothetical protein [Bacteroidota bacterium]